MRLAALLLLFPLAAFPGGKTQTRIGEGQGANAVASLDATVYADPESVRQVVGDSLGGYYIVVRVKLSPKSGKLAVQLDDFQLKTDKDGERSHPFAPTQIAGQGVLIVSETANGGGGKAQRNRPTFGGVGMPSGSSAGNAAPVMGAEGKMKQEENANPLVKTLGEKMLPEKETEEPVSGLLYFPMDKQKVKDLELAYTTPSGKVTVRFHQ